MNLSSHEPLQTLSGHLMWQVHFRQTGSPVLTLLHSREPVAVVANEAAEAVAFGCVLSLAASSFWRNSCRAFCACPEISYTKNGLRTSKARTIFILAMMKSNLSKRSKGVDKPDILHDLHLASQRTATEGCWRTAVVVENFECFCQRKYFLGLLRSPSAFQTECREKLISVQKEERKKFSLLRSKIVTNFNSTKSLTYYTWRDEGLEEAAADEDSMVRFSEISISPSIRQRRGCPSSSLSPAASSPMAPDVVGSVAARWAAAVVTEKLVPDSPRKIEFVQGLFENPAMTKIIWRR